MPPIQKLLSAKLLSLALAGYILMRALIHFEGESLPVLCIAGLLLWLLALIWFGNWIAANLLPIGRMARFASDADSALLQGPVVALLGWILLALLFVMVTLWSRSETPAVSLYYYLST